MRRIFKTLVRGVLGIALLCMVAAPVVRAAAPGEVEPWVTSPNSLPDIITAPGYATANDYAYVVGGIGGSGWLDTVYYTHLNDDGTIDPWVTSPNNLPHTIYDPSAVAYNGYLYVMGGYGGGFQDILYYAPINGDGSIGTWTTSPNLLPEGLYESEVVATNDRLYLFGGTGSGGVPIDQIFTVPINGDGSVGTWTTSSSTLPIDIRQAVAVFYDGYVYIAGGDNGPASLDTVYYTTLNGDGTTGTWTLSPNSLPVATKGPAGVTANGFLYVIGGNDDSDELDTVYYAPFLDGGGVGAWTENPNSLPQPRQHAVAFTAHSYLFVAGGQNGPAEDEVFSAFATPQLSPTPDPSPSPSSTTSGETLANTGQDSSIIMVAAVLLLTLGVILFLLIPPVVKQNLRMLLKL